MPRQSSPLSFAQQRLWFLEQLTPGLAVFNVPLVFEMEGPLDASLLESALGEIVRRHEPLRTIFPAVGGRPRQEIVPYRPIAVAVEDFADCDPNERESLLNRRVEEEARRPFDLQAGPVLRASLLRLQPGLHRFIIVFHHISFDGWSGNVLFRELAALYDALSSGRPSPLPELPMQYRDFAVRQREAMNGESLKRQLAYWREQLRPPLPTLTLPTDRPRPAVQTHRGWREHDLLPTALVDCLQDMSRREGVTLFMLFLAAYAAQIHRLSGQDDLIVGTPIANRTRQDIEPLMGFFVNTLALRLDLSGDPSFRDLLQQAKRVALGAYANQEMPFDRIVQELKPERTLSHTPVVQTCLSFDNTPLSLDEGLAVGGVVMRRITVSTGTAKFDLMLSIRRRDGGRRISFEGSADLFDASAGPRLLRMFKRLVEGVLEDPSRRVSQLPLLSDQDRRQVVEWQAAAAPEATPRTIVGLIEEQVARTPATAAIVHGDLDLSYADLNTRANAVMRQLRRRGVGVGDRVGICLRRTPDLPVAILGVLKAGAAYVPLDPANPADRIRYMVRDAGCALIVTDQASRAHVATCETVLFAIDEVDDLRPAAGDTQEAIAGPEHLAYVMYTSGSTGTPKGVAIEHRNVVNLIAWARRMFSDDELSGMLASTSIGFDLSVFELFVPLAAGGTVILVENLIALSTAPERTRVTFINTVPSFMRELLRLDRLPPRVSVVAMAGEPLHQRLVAAVYQEPAVEKVYDLYGPTEATVYATCALRSADGPTTIGRPIDNTSALVLDADQQAVPIGVAGELYLGGSGVARGYFGRDGLTAERFIVDPLPGAAFGRMFRTGDRVRWRPDGSLEFLGRSDRQVKLRGLRIELGEIESVLAGLPDVQEAAVLRMEDPAGVASLAAFVVARQAVETDRLFEELEAKLPHYMRPASIEPLPALPKLASGKVDYEALRTRVAASRVASRDQTGSPVSEPMRLRLLDWAGAAVSYPRDRTVSQLFESQAIDMPDAPAIVSAEGSLTFRDVNERANRLAHYISSRRTDARALDSPDSRPLVGVCLERSVESVVALLAILKADCAYLPLDPTSPPARLASLIQEARPGCIVTRKSLAGRLGDTAGALLEIDTDAVAITESLATNPGLNVEPEALAYVLFTSGTTGTPKAVGVPHRAIVRLAYGLPDAPAGPGNVMLHLAPLTFDAATFELWAPLLQGGCVAIAPEHLITSSSLEAFIAAHHVTIMWLTASLFNAVIDERPEALAGLRCLVTGGEALSVVHVERALAALPRTRLINGYGPTETTTFACCHVIRAEDLTRARSVPIGRPLANTRVYVLDPERRLLPAGEAGELWIGGDGVAHGYLNDRDLTDAKFIADPFADREGARMYRSGDRACFLPDGTLEFLGRLDDQIKLRGFRIEPGEIEAALAAHAGVSRAIVSLVDLPIVGRSLAAFVIPSAGSVEGSELRDFLRQQLPDYMVPSHWVAVSRIPLLSSGKTDRQALAAMAIAATHSAVHPASTWRSRTEELIGAIWCNVLGLTTVGADDDFFDLGGHSLLATQVLSRIQAAFSVQIELRALFTQPTIADLAREVERLSAAHTGETAAIPRAPRDGSLPLSFAQQRLWFLHHWYGDTGVYNMPNAFRIAGQLDVAALSRALQTIVDRHELLRTALPFGGGRPIQHVASQLALALPVIDVSALEADEAEAAAVRLAAEDSRRAFDLSTGPLMRCALVRLSGDTHVLLLTLHHIAADGWSLGVLFRELRLLYEAESRNTPPVLDRLPIQYADFAVWQRQHLTGPRLERHLDYWRRHMHPPPPALDMPLDRPRPLDTTTRGGHVSFRVPPEVTEPLARFSAGENATLFVALLAGYQAVLHRYSGQDDVCVGTPIAGRTRAELEPLIGCFVNTLAMRADFSDDPTFRSLVQRTREAAIDAQVHQELPFELLVEALNVERRANQSPIFQAMFNFREGLSTSLELPGLVVTRVAVAFDFAKFELSVDLRPVGGGLHGQLEYNADLFDRETAEGIAKDFTTLLTDAVEKPDRRISEIVLPDAERKRRSHRRLEAAPAAATVDVVPVRADEPHDIERRLASIWQRVLECPSVSSTDNFFALGGHSLMAVRLFAEIEDAFGVKLPLSTLFRNGTVSEQARLLGAHAQEDVWSPVVPIQPLGTRPPFFIVHGIGGEVLSFQALADHLGPDQPVFGLQADWRDDGRHMSTIEEVATRYVCAMRSVVSEGPYLVGGYSSGGVIAFEMAQQLRAEGREAGLLAMLDSFAPSSRTQPLTPALIWEVVKNAAYWPLDDDFFRSGWTAQRARVRGKVHATRARRGRKNLRAALVEGADVRDLLGLWKVPATARPFLERYVAMIEAYRPQDYAGTVAVFRARTLSLTYRGTTDLGWARLARGGVTTHIVPGAHDTILKEPRVRELAVALSHRLEAVAREAADPTTTAAARP